VTWQGETVGMPQILDLRHILTESTTDLRQPIGLERQLLESSQSTDDEVGLSMLQLLKVSPCLSTTCPLLVHCLSTACPLPVSGLLDIQSDAYAVL